MCRHLTPPRGGWGGVLLLFLLLPLTLSAQEERELLPVDWEQIARTANDEPERIQQLVVRLAAPQLDTTLTYPDRILAFYGQSFITNDGEESMRLLMDRLLDEEKLDDCLAMAEKILQTNPLHLGALITAANVLSYMAADSTRWTYITDEAAEPYVRRVGRIFNTIAMTGDGSEEHPFAVTKISDEYHFMRYYLDLWDYESQTLAGHCDVFTLQGEGSDYYRRPTIYFDVTRVLELERRMFEP